MNFKISKKQYYQPLIKLLRILLPALRIVFSHKLYLMGKDEVTTSFRDSRQHTWAQRVVRGLPSPSRKFQKFGFCLFIYLFIFGSYFFYFFIPPLAIRPCLCMAASTFPIFLAEMPGLWVVIRKFSFKEVYFLLGKCVHGSV